MLQYFLLCYLYTFIPQRTAQPLVGKKWILLIWVWIQRNCIYPNTLPSVFIFVYLQHNYQTRTRFMKAARLNQNIKVAGHKTTTMGWKMLKTSVELQSGDIYLCTLSSKYHSLKLMPMRKRNFSKFNITWFMIPAFCSSFYKVYGVQVVIWPIVYIKIFVKAKDS